MSKNELANKPGLELEYNTLRSEILKRIEFRQQFISITLTLAGIFLGIGLTNDLVVLIYPPLAMFLALGWVQNDFRVRVAAQYIRERFETPETGLHYETYIQKEREKNKNLAEWRLLPISHSGIFLFTQFMAVGIELSKSASFNFIPLKWALLALDALAIIIVAWSMGQTARLSSYLPQM